MLWEIMHIYNSNHYSSTIKQIINDCLMKFFLEAIEIKIDGEINKDIYLEYGANDNGRIDILLKIIVCSIF